jgi:hypothetical protein
MAEADEKVFEDVLTDEMLVAMSEVLGQFAGLVDQTADYAASKKPNSPGAELYWGGYTDGLRDAANMAREARPLRGVKRG